MTKQRQLNAVESTGNQNNQIKPCRFVLTVQQHGLSAEIFNINDRTHPTLQLLQYSIAKTWQIILRVSHISCYRIQRVKVQVEPTRSATAIAITTPVHVRLWDTASKFLCPGLFMTSPDHLGKIPPNALHNLSLTILFPWQHTGFQTSPILNAFLATLGVQLSYLQMVPDTHDPTSIPKC